MRLAIIGKESRVRGYELAGAMVMVAETPREAREQWSALPGNVGVVILTAAAAEAIGNLDERMTVVLS